MKTKEFRPFSPAANADPLTGEPGSHPIATGLGAAGAGMAGAVGGAMLAGPIGAVVGSVLGATAGAYGGHVFGESIEPTREDAFWRQAHPHQPYAAGTTYEDFRDAYRVGYEGAAAEGPEIGGFEEAEPELRAKYEAGEKVLPWIKVRVATQSAWSRVHAGRKKAGPTRTSAGVY